MKQLFRASIIILSAIFLFLTSSCDSNRFYEQNIQMPEYTWPSSESKKFLVDIKDTTSAYNFYLNVRNTNDYPFANLYLFIQTTFPDSLYARDTIELQLATKDGKWLGEGYGKFKYRHFILRKGMYFHQKGIYEFRIEQGMRKDTLLGIADIGIRLEYYP